MKNPPEQQQQQLQPENEHRRSTASKKKRNKKRNDLRRLSRYRYPISRPYYYKVKAKIARRILKY